MNEIISVKKMIEDAVTKSSVLRISMIKGAWHSIVGELWLKSEPLGIKDGVLYTAVENSMYLHTMEMRKNSYIEKINRLLRGQYVVDIKYRVRKIDLKQKIERGNGITLPKKEEKLTEYKTKDMSIEESIKYLASISKKREKILFENGYRRCEKCRNLFLGKEKLCPKCRGEKETLTINRY